MIVRMAPCDRTLESVENVSFKTTRNTDEGSDVLASDRILCRLRSSKPELLSEVNFEHMLSCGEKGIYELLSHMLGLS